MVRFVCLRLPLAVCILSWFMFSTSFAQEQLIFTAEWEGNWDIYRLMNGEVEPLTDSPERDLWPSLSHDGKWLVYTTGINKNSELVLVDMEEGIQKRLTKSALSEAETAWSPDSTQLAFVGGLFPPGGPNVIDDYDIFLMDIESGETHKLVDGPWNDRHPDWSPKGDKLVFQSDRDKRYRDGIFLFDFRTGKTQRLTPESVVRTRTPELTFEEMVARTPKWSPDGKQIAFFSRTSVLGTRPDFMFSQIWVRKLDGTLVDSFGVDKAWNSEPAASPDGQKIAFVASRKIYLYDRGTRQITQLTHPQDADHEPGQLQDADHQPDWSPDGERLVFVSRRNGNVDIWVMNANGEAQVNLTRNETPEYTPTWSPLGNQIAYAQREVDGSRYIYVMGPDGGHHMRVSQTPGTNLSPTWSPQGDRLAYLNYTDADADVPAAERPFTIYVLDMQNQHCDVLYQGVGRVVRIDWSPDGKQMILGRQFAPGQTLVLGDIQVVDVATGKARSLEPAPMALEEVVWSSREGEIVFSALWPELFKHTTGILFMDAEGNIHREIFPEVEPQDSRGLAWSPDGRKLVYTARADGHLYVLDLESETTELLVRSAAYPCWRDPARFLDVAPHGKLATMWHAIRQEWSTVDSDWQESLDTKKVGIPQTTRLLRNYPNPCNPETWIAYELADPVPVRIDIQDVAGNPVRTLRLGTQPAGSYASKSKAAYWDGRTDMGEETASGVYYYTIRAGEFIATRTMALLR